MSTLVQTLKRNTYGIAALILFSAMVLPVTLASTASAELITSRSIDMSTSAPSATGAAYTINFTPATSGSIQGIVIEFCADSPLIGVSCTAPTMTAGTGIAAGAFKINNVADNNWTAAILTDPDVTGEAIAITRATSGTAVSDSTPINIVVTGFTNPSELGTFYARILTYAATASAAGYESEDPEAVGAVVDSGSVALSTAETIDINAQVMESLTFCVSGSAPSAGCTGTDSPDLTLGDGSPGYEALSTDEVSEAIAYFQLSTNAAGTTAVKLRNGAASGGLNSGSNFIPPIDDTTPQTLALGVAGFGVRLPTVNTGDPGSADVNAAATYGSDETDEYNMTAAAVNPYGDLIASATGPVSNVNVPLTFGAQASNLTAAGVYSTSIVLIATSTY